MDPFAEWRAYLAEDSDPEMLAVCEEIAQRLNRHPPGPPSDREIEDMAADIVEWGTAYDRQCKQYPNGLPDAPTPAPPRG